MKKIKVGPTTIKMADKVKEDMLIKKMSSKGFQKNMKLYDKALNNVREMQRKSVGKGERIGRVKALTNGQFATLTEKQQNYYLDQLKALTKDNDFKRIEREKLDTIAAIKKVRRESEKAKRTGNNAAIKSTNLQIKNLQDKFEAGLTPEQKRGLKNYHTTEARVAYIARSLSKPQKIVDELYKTYNKEIVLNPELSGKVEKLLEAQSKIKKAVDAAVNPGKYTSRIAKKKVGQYLTKHFSDGTAKTDQLIKSLYEGNFEKLVKANLTKKSIDALVEKGVSEELIVAAGKIGLAVVEGAEGPVGWAMLIADLVGNIVKPESNEQEPEIPNPEKDPEPEPEPEPEDGGGEWEEFKMMLTLNLIQVATINEVSPKTGQQLHGGIRDEEIDKFSSALDLEIPSQFRDIFARRAMKHIDSITPGNYVYASDSTAEGMNGSLSDTLNKISSMFNQMLSNGSLVEE